MKKQTLATATLLATVIALVLTAGLSAAEREDVAAADGRLSEDERNEIVNVLEVTQSDLLDRIEGLSDKAFNYKPAPDRWSLAQIVEHLVIVEKSVLGGAEQAVASTANPEWAGDTAGQTDRLYRFVPNRVQRFQAPDSVQPKGEMGRKEMLRSYKELRAKAIAMIQDDAPLKAHTSEHPVLGPMGVHQWLLFTGLHNLRHNQQAVEVMADPGFPH